MVSGQKRPSLLAIVGPTASGKSDLAMKIAKEFNGEIICADSRTIYKGMDIGTAKPSLEEQKEIPHWGLDLIKPGQRFSAAQFKAYAEQVIKDVQARNKLLIIVGGTGLYVDSVLYDYQFSPNGGERDPVNPRHLKKTEAAQANKSLRPNTLIIGLLPSDEVLKDRIAKRAEHMFGGNVIKEVGTLEKHYGRKNIASSAGIIYRIIPSFLDREIDKQQALELFKTADWQYARRQKTWFKRNAHINWFNDPKEAEKFVQKQLMNT